MENTIEGYTSGTQIPLNYCPKREEEGVFQALKRVRDKASTDKSIRFAQLYHHLTPSLLSISFQMLKKNAAAGVDGVEWRDYDANMWVNIMNLHERVRKGSYRA